MTQFEVIIYQINVLPLSLSTTVAVTTAGGGGSPLRVASPPNSTAAGGGASSSSSPLHQVVLWKGRAFCVTPVEYVTFLCEIRNSFDTFCYVQHNSTCIIFITVFIVVMRSFSIFSTEL